MKTIIAAMALMVSAQTSGSEVDNLHKYKVIGSGYRINIIEFSPKGSDGHLCIVAIDSSSGGGIGIGLSCFKKTDEQ